MLRRAVVEVCLRPALLVMWLAGSGCRGDQPVEASEVSGVELRASMLGSALGFVDFDGDGVLDPLVAAPHARKGEQLGAVFVYAGSGPVPGSAPIAVLSAERELGAALADVGDVDGDQVRDYALAALHGTRDSQAAALSGTVAVYAGGRRSERLATLTGQLPASLFGFAVVGGDFNADGHADVAVGSPLHSPDATLYQQGAVSVFLGPALQQDLRLDASSALGGLGWALAAGDVSGDGVDDLVLSSVSPGRVLAFFGAPGFRPALEAPDASWQSAANSFGQTLAVISDLNGDGARELAIGAPKSSVDGGREVGSVFIVSLQPDLREPIDLDAHPDAARRVDGAAPFSRFGAAIAPLQDDALAIGAPFADHADNDMVGAVFVLSGEALGEVRVLEGSDAHGAFGAAIAQAPDGALWIGAPRAQADRGRVQRLPLARARPAALGGAGARDAR